MKVETVLVATDFSELSDQAAVAGADLARIMGARVTLVHVSDPPFLLGDATHSLVSRGSVQTEHWGEELAAEKLALQAGAIASDGVEVDTRFIEGKPAQVIDGLARELGAGLIVMGTHGYRGVDRLLLGSVAAQLVRRAPVPVLAIPPGGFPSPPTSLERIVLATDFSDSADRAAEQAGIWARHLGAAVLVLHSLDRPSTYEFATSTREGPAFAPTEELVRMQGQRAEVVAERLRDVGVEATSLLVQGPAAENAVAVAVERGAGLIVMGTRGHSPMRRFFMGSSADRVLRTAHCAVLTCRPLE